MALILNYSIYMYDKNVQETAAAAAAAVPDSDYYGTMATYYSLNVFPNNALEIIEEYTPGTRYFTIIGDKTSDWIVLDNLKEYEKHECGDSCTLTGKAFMEFPKKWFSRRKKYREHAIDLLSKGGFTYKAYLLLKENGKA